MLVVASIIIPPDKQNKPTFISTTASSLTKAPRHNDRAQIIKPLRSQALAGSLNESLHAMMNWREIIALFDQRRNKMNLHNRIRSFQHATRGIARFVQTGANAKIQTLGAFVAVATAIILDFTLNEWIAVLLCIALVLSLEAINSALETLADEVTLEKRNRIRDTKDMAAGAVLIASLISAIIYGLLVARHLPVLQ
jgi:diacylglycerol kinase (ATP)